MYPLLILEVSMWHPLPLYYIPFWDLTHASSSFSATSVCGVSQFTQTACSSGTTYTHFLTVTLMSLIQVCLQRCFCLFSQFLDTKISMYIFDRQRRIADNDKTEFPTRLDKRPRSSWKLKTRARNTHTYISKHNIVMTTEKETQSISSSTVKTITDYSIA